MMKTVVFSMVLALVACSSPPGESPADPAHNSRNALDWQGTYIGTTPCADCEGIRTTVTLMQDGTFARDLIYLGKSGDPMHDTGSFSWNDTGSAITLAPGSQSSQQYQVAENRLVHLDRSGKRIGGELADRYILEKTVRDPRVEDQRWLLDEAMGQPVEPSEDLGEAFIKFDSSQGRFSGNASCNNFFGNYVLLAGNRIDFVGHAGATMMACPDMHLEVTVLEALGKIDNYSVDGDRLSLNRARMAPLLVFRLATDDG
jgi:heat shock protein HslJ